MTDVTSSELRTSNDHSVPAQEVFLTTPVAKAWNIEIKRVTPPEDIQNGQDLVYQVLFPPTKAIPTVFAIDFNNNLYCSAPRGQVQAGYTTLSSVDFFSTPVAIRRPQGDFEAFGGAFESTNETLRPTTNFPVSTLHEAPYDLEVPVVPIADSSEKAHSMNPLPVDTKQPVVQIPTTAAQQVPLVPPSTFHKIFEALKPALYSNGTSVETAATAFQQILQTLHSSSTNSKSSATNVGGLPQPLSQSQGSTPQSSISGVPEAETPANASQIIFPTNSAERKPQVSVDAHQASTMVKQLTTNTPEAFQEQSVTPKPESLHQSVHSGNVTKVISNMSSRVFNRHFEVADCGDPADTQALLVNGNPTTEGQYPWLIAMFHLQDVNGEYKFRCAANLVSNTYAITAAHCVRAPDQSPLLPKENIVLVLGKHNIRSWAVRSEIRDVKRIFVHPDYTKPSDADIAVLEMYKPVNFTSTIKPVCLWVEEDTVATIVGFEGIVVGWGRDEFDNTYVPEPRQLTMPVVSQEDCLRSDPRFLKLTSARTFCAGTRKGEGPCTGDSGGGFFMIRKGRWVLEGIVSSALVDPKTRSCDVNNYMVFADVSKYLPWIKRIMSR